MRKIVIVVVSALKDVEPFLKIKPEYLSKDINYTISN